MGQRDPWRCGEEGGRRPAQSVTFSRLPGFLFLLCLRWRALGHSQYGWAPPDDVRHSISTARWATPNDVRHSTSIGVTWKSPKETQVLIMKITKLLVMLKYLGERPRRLMVSKNEDVLTGIKSWLTVWKTWDTVWIDFSISMMIKEYVAWEFRLFSHWVSEFF